MSQTVKSYKDLKFWVSAKQTSILVLKLIRTLPNSREYWVISDQLLKSCFSVAANITEGFGKYKEKST